MKSFNIKDFAKNFASGFSLMEMMIVMLIVAIMAAATAPMITKKMARNAGSGDSPWVFTNNHNIAFPASDATIISGATETSGDGHPNLFLKSHSDNDAQIVFASNLSKPDTNFTNDLVKLRSVSESAKWPTIMYGAGITDYGKKFSSSVLIGNGIILDKSADRDSSSCTVLGSRDLNSTEYLIPGDGSISVGYNAKGSGEKSVAIGYGANASGKNSIAIGNGVQAGLENTIKIGTDSNTTRIDGTLSVGKLNIGNTAYNLSTANINGNTVLVLTNGSSSGNGFDTTPRGVTGGGDDNGYNTIHKPPEDLKPAVEVNRY